MAKRDKRGKQSPERYVEGMVELIAALSNIRNGGNGHGVPLTDPSINTNARVDAVADALRREAALTERFEEKIRNNDRAWSEKLDAQKDRATESARKEEAARIDNKIQDIVSNQTIATQELKNTATTLAKTVSDTAETARKTVEVAAQQQSELIGQVRDSVTEVRNLVTNFIAAGGATKEATTEQMTEQRWSQRQRSQNSQWLIGLAIFGGLAFLGLIVSVGNFLSTHIK